MDELMSCEILLSFLMLKQFSLFSSKFICIFLDLVYFVGPFWALLVVATCQADLNYHSAMVKRTFPGVLLAKLGQLSCVK